MTMLKILYRSILDDILFLLISWKQYWPDNIIFPEQKSIEEKRYILNEILCAMDEIEFETLSQERFGVFRQVTSHNYVGFIADGISSNSGWYIDSEKIGVVLNRKRGVKNAVHFMKNKYTKMGMVLLVFDWKFYMSYELSIKEAERLFKEYSKDIL